MAVGRLLLRRKEEWVAADNNVIAERGYFCGGVYGTGVVGSVRSSRSLESE